MNLITYKAARLSLGLILRQIQPKMVFKGGKKLNWSICSTQALALAQQGRSQHYFHLASVRACMRTSVCTYVCHTFQLGPHATWRAEIWHRYQLQGVDENAIKLFCDSCHQLSTAVENENQPRELKFGSSMNISMNINILVKFLSYQLASAVNS